MAVLALIIAAIGVLGTLAVNGALLMSGSFGKNYEAHYALDKNTGIAESAGPMEHTNLTVPAENAPIASEEGHNDAAETLGEQFYGAYQAELETYRELDSGLAFGDVKQAQAAYQVWDDELNAVYRRIKAAMTKEEFELLRRAERAWLKERDDLAEKECSGKEGEAARLAELVSLTKSTRERTHELLEMYYTLLQRKGQ